MDDCYDLKRDLKGAFDGKMPSKSQAEAYLGRKLSNYEATELYARITKPSSYRTPEQRVEDKEWGGVEEGDW